MKCFINNELGSYVNARGRVLATVCYSSTCLDMCLFKIYFMMLLVPQTMLDQMEGLLPNNELEILLQLLEELSKTMKTLNSDCRFLVRNLNIGLSE
jgi:hypothetical protein